MTSPSSRMAWQGSSRGSPWPKAAPWLLLLWTLVFSLVPVVCGDVQPPSTKKNAAVAAAPPPPPPNAVGAHANPRAAHFVLPEEPRHEHQLLLKQLEQLGVERFVPKDPENRLHFEQDEKLVWDLLPSHSDSFDLLWSIKPLPVFFNEMEFPEGFKTKINHLPGSQALLGTRRALQDHVVTMQDKYGKFHFHFVPPSFVLPRDQTAFDAFWNQKKMDAQYDTKILRDSFIYQRFLLHPVGHEDETGRIVISSEELRQRLASDEFRGKEVQATFYIEPFLLDGRKFKIGRFVALTSLDPLRIYVYDNAVVQISTRRYPPTLSSATPVESYEFDEKTFINPWDFQDLQRFYKEFPSPNREGTNSWHVTKQYMAERGLDTLAIEKDMREIIGKLLLSARDTFQQEIRGLKTKPPTSGQAESLENNFFELWRFDFEISDLGKVYLNKILPNPSFEPVESSFGSDAAVKKNVLYDLINLIGVPKHARTSFDKFFEPKGSFCQDKCQDTTRTWDATCWKCPKWFAPPVASKLFEAAQEYNRRGNFELIFPDLDTSYSKFLVDVQLSEHDMALQRYIKSLGSVIAQKEDLFDVGIQAMCVYREHCNNHGDCLNGVCLCDEEYEGATCYLPRDPKHIKAPQRNPSKAKSAMQSWKERMEGLLLGDRKEAKATPQKPHRPNRRNPPDLRRVERDRDRERQQDTKRLIQRQAAAQAQAQLQQREAQDNELDSEEENFSAGTLVFSLVVLSVFLYGAYSIFVSCSTSVDSRKNN